MLANSIALLTLAVMIAFEARRAEGVARPGLYSLATVVALVAIALKPITAWLPVVGTTLTGIFTSPLAWFVLLMGLYLAIRPFWLGKATAEKAPEHDFRALGARAGTLAYKISSYRHTGYLWRDRLPDIVPIVLDGQSALISLAKAGFEVPAFQSEDAARVAVGQQSYFNRIHPLIRDGHIEIALEQSRIFADQAELAATALQHGEFWTDD